jgi:hypothetical protein
LIEYVLPANKTGALQIDWKHEINKSEGWELVFRLMHLEPLNAAFVGEYESANIFHLAGEFLLQDRFKT